MQNTERGTSEIGMNDLIEVAVLAGDFVRKHFGSSYAVSEKARNDFVTEIDIEAESIIKQSLRDRCSSIGFLGEETGGSFSNGLTAHIDPIDGTQNYISQIPFYAVSIALELESSLIAGVIYDPEREEVFSADTDHAYLNSKPIRARHIDSESEAAVSLTWPYEAHAPSSHDLHLFDAIVRQFRTVRRLGSAALGLAYVASGRLDVSTELRAKPWDVAAGFLLVDRAGGHVARPSSECADRLPPEFEAMTTPDWYAQRYVAYGPHFPYEDSTIQRVTRYS